MSSVNDVSDLVGSSFLLEAVHSKLTADNWLKFQLSAEKWRVFLQQHIFFTHFKVLVQMLKLKLPDVSMFLASFSRQKWKYLGENRI